MGPQNSLIGDSFGIDLPEMRVDKNELNEEKRKARFSKTKEFQQLKAKMESRIAFYQAALPDGRPVTAVDTAERAQQWVIANAIIGEFKLIIAEYEDAAEVVKHGRS